MSMLKSAVAAVAALVLGSTSALAVGLTPSNSGGNSVFAASPDGNVMGLFTLVNASVGDTLTLTDFQDLVLSGPTVLNVFAGSPDTLPPVGAGNNRDGGVSVAGFVDPFGANANGGLTVTSLSRSSGSVFDAVFLEFDVAGFGAPDFNVVVSNGAGGTGTFTFDAKSVPVDLGTPTPVPVPAALPLLAAGLGVFGLIARRKARAAA